MKCKKHSKLVNIAKKKQIHRYREHTNKLMVFIGGKGQYSGEGVGDTIGCKVSYKDILYNMRNIANIL